ncbi:hypothetical protein EDD15DRAFT_2193745 [Pisolithus albus]|nr:hypothetical protein EDD15DRAFT_2204174 [Pisolithus albus]KAI5999716.1 hypothetical protein EDD15DRAFT_2193745 [Pisolithus albus]
MARDQMVVVIDDEYSSVENVDMADVFDTQPVNEPAPTATNLKRKRSGTAGDGSEHTSEANTGSKEEIEVIGEIARGHRVTSKTSVSAIDTDELRTPAKGIGPRHRILSGRVQKSRSSITPSVASDSVPASDFPESEMTRASNSSSRFTNSDLPPLFLKGRKWAKLFLPTLLLWVGDQPNVWSVPEDNLVHALTEIAKVVYPTFSTLDDIRPNMPIFAVASQRLSGWRHSLGSTAIALVDCYLASDSDTDVERTCDAFLNKRAFAYEDLDSSSPDKAFHGAFVLQLLANAHLRSCAGSVDVPPLGLTPKTYKARGAIALCVTASDLHGYSCMSMQLERAIKLMKSKYVSGNAMEKGRAGANLLKGNRKCKSGGRPANAEHTFSEQNWGSATSSYFQSVSNREPHILQGIVRMSHAILQDDSDDNSSVDDLTEDLLEGEVDARALMYVISRYPYKHPSHEHNLYFVLVILFDSRFGNLSLDTGDTTFIIILLMLFEVK